MLQPTAAEIGEVRTVLASTSIFVLSQGRQRAWPTISPALLALADEVIE
jgi:hypothetical protein